MRRARDDEQAATLDVGAFDYTAAAELFAGFNGKGNKGSSYNRFDTAAEALRFAIETAPAQTMLGLQGKLPAGQVLEGRP